MKRYLLRTIALWVRGLMLALLSVSLVALFTESAHAQVRFARTYGGTNGEWANSVQQTSDGGYIVAGITTSFGSGSGDAFLVKTDAYGNVQWAKTYGVSLEEFTSVQQTSDGGYIAAGQIYFCGMGLPDILLIKTDANGNVIWAKVYCGPFNFGDVANSVQQTSDGGYILTGITNSYTYIGTLDSAFLIKTDANGNIQWAKTYHLLLHGRTWSYSVQQTSDGGYIMSGLAEEYDSIWMTYRQYVFLIKTDANGNVIWAKTYRGFGFGDIMDVSNVSQTSDGGYIVAGRITATTATMYDVFLIKTDANGNIQWAKTYGGTNWDGAYSVQQTSDGGYILAGYTNSFGAGGYDPFLIKTDANGNIQWAKTYGGTGHDMFFHIQQTSDGGYIATGYTYSFGAGSIDVILIKTDANGNIGSCGIVRNASPFVNNMIGFAIPRYPQVGYLPLTVYSLSPTVTSPTFSSSQVCVLSFDDNVGISESCKPVSGLITPYKGGIKVSGSGEFEVKVYNVSGVMVKSIKGKNEVKLELSRGVYFVEVISGGKVIREKVVVR
ncbi:MAG: T9SS type A sorting domain-containing protein [Candidatus Caldipriscus sp.]